ncbi:(2Fe-2S) ferredoxin domain-containing protein [Flavobacterium sp. DGU11]|uniref:(2Fe-2S) ferredoxin domain-containing protein n=1 Tax=Flavobacterium arundinis TaxID=3139143 RepID=A0ABU9HZV9_9FLAO
MKRDVELTCMECTDNCKTAPNICLQPHNVWIGEVEEKDVKDIFKKYIL